MSDIVKILDEKEARANAATDGPWNASLTGRGARVSEPSGYPLPGCFTCGQNEEGIYEPADAEFIARARTDVPALVAALRAVLALDGPMTGENSGVEYMAAVRAAITSALGGER